MGLSDEQLQVECAALMLNWMPPEERDALHRRIGELEADRARRAEPQEAARQFQPTDECRRQFTAPAERKEGE